MPPNDRRSFAFRVLAILALATLASAAYAWYFGMETMLVVQAQYMSQKAPIVKKTPMPLRDSAVSQARGRNLKSCGYAFDVPWSDMDASQTKMSANGVVIYFRSGLVLMLKCVPAREFVNSFISSGQMTVEDFRQLFGDENLQSDYAFTKMMLNCTPDEITLRTSRKEAVAKLIVLTVKAIAVPSADSGIFGVRTDEFEGFQYEDPQSHPQRVVADLFAPDQTLEFVFQLNHRSASPRISQAEINRVLQSARKQKNRKDKSVDQ